MSRSDLDQIDTMDGIELSADEANVEVEVDNTDDDVVDIEFICDHGVLILEESCAICERDFDRAVGIPIGVVPNSDTCAHGRRYEDGCRICEQELVDSLDHCV